MSTQTAIELAKDPNTPPEVLNELATLPDEGVRIRVAYNPSSPVSALETLVNKEFSPYCNGLVHYYVAQHPNTTQRLKNYLIAKHYVTSNRH